MVLQSFLLNGPMLCVKLLSDFSIMLFLEMFEKNV